MIRVKNDGTTLVQTGGDQFNPIMSSVFEAQIKPNYLGKGRASFEVLFTGKNPNWYETKTVTPAREADPENNIEAKEAVLDVCPEKETTDYGWHPFPAFECGPFEADIDDVNITALCEDQAIVILGNVWEVKP